MRTLVVWDACWSSGRSIPEGWETGIRPRTYIRSISESAYKRRARITSISAGIGSQCLDRLPGGTGPALSYLLLAGLVGWGDADDDERVDGDELGGFLQAWSRSIVDEREAVRAWVEGRPATGVASAEFVAVRGNWHSSKASVRRPTMAELMIGDSAPPEVRGHAWAGGAVIEMPAVPPELQRAARERPPLARVVETTRKGAPLPSELASLWCSLDVPDLAELVDWECQRRRAFARRWQSFLPLLDADAAMLRDALAKAAWQGATARGLVTRLTLSFLETYRAYASHPKVRAVRATLAAEGFRDKVRLASRGPMIEVEGGSFERGCTEGTRGCEPDEVPLRSVYLSSFAIDEFEVSERDYAYCVRSGICKPRRPEQCYAYDPDRGFASGRGATLGAGNRPATCVSWQQAAQYCRWIGGRLPTEAEWERAARGRKERAYPWSDATGEDPVGCDHANHFACGERLLPVDAPLLGRSPNGIAHLAGNAAEWVSDYYGPYRRGSNPRGPRAPSTTARAA